MKRYATTQHFQNDRLDRATYIAMHVGFGEVVKTRVTHKDGRYAEERLTSTGVLMIFNDIGELITMFVASKSRAKEIYGNEKLPAWLDKVININYKRHYIENQG